MVVMVAVIVRQHLEYQAQIEAALGTGKTKAYWGESSSPSWTRE